MIMERLPLVTIVTGGLTFLIWYLAYVVEPLSAWLPLVGIIITLFFLFNLLLLVIMVVYRIGDAYARFLEGSRPKAVFKKKTPSSWSMSPISVLKRMFGSGSPVPPAQSDPGTEKKGIDLDVRAMVLSVANALWAIYHRRPDVPSLILPTTRDGGIRVSEQESRMLLSHWLERNGVPHSVETPTVETYQQTGQVPLSARMDLTVYHSRQPDDRALNVELKKGTPDDEAFRKDMEKLFRERTDGLWFHTLTKADSRTWSTIEEKLGRAFDTERRHLDAATHSMSFAYCVLDPPQLVWFDLDLHGDLESQWPQAMRNAVDDPSTPEWWIDAPSPPAYSKSPSPAIRSSRKGSEKWLIYCRDLCADSFVHLNIQGNSYRLRFGCFGVRGSVDPEAPTTELLRSRYGFTHQVDVKAERVNLTKDPQYWMDRISALNRQYGIKPFTGEQGRGGFE